MIIKSKLLRLTSLLLLIVSCGGGGGSSQKLNHAKQALDVEIASITTNVSGIVASDAVEFEVNFTSAVSQLDISSFELVGSSNGATIQSVTKISNTKYNLVVSLPSNASGSFKLASKDQDEKESIPVEFNRTLGSIVTDVESPSSLSTINYTIDFGREVQGVDVSDFVINNSPSGLSIGSVTTSDNQNYTISILTTNNIFQTLRLDLISSHNITDMLANPLPAIHLTGEVIVVDTIVPTTPASIAPVEAPAPNASSIEYVINFGEEVENVDVSDFYIEGLPAGVTVSSVTTTDGQNYVVTVEIADGVEADIELKMDENHNITDTAGNSVPAVEVASDVISIDTKDPEVSVAGVSTSASPISNVSPLSYTIDFGEVVENVDVGDFSLEGNPVGVTISGVTTSDNQTYTVTVDVDNGVTANVQLNLNEDHDIVDSSGNALAAVAIDGEAVTIDRDAPVSPSEIATSESGPSNASSFEYTITFPEAVSNVDASDFSFEGNPAGLSITNIATSDNTTFTITVGVASGFEGEVQLNLNSGHNITDLAGNIVPASQVDGAPVEFDRKKPELLAASIIRASGAPQLVTGESADFEVTFSEAVSNVDASDFSLNFTGSAEASISNITTLDNIVYIVTVNAFDGDGNIDLQLADVDNDITDSVGNTLENSNVDGAQVYTVDKTSPTVAITSSETSPTTTTPIPFTVTFSEDVDGFTSADLTVSAGTISNFTTVNAKTYTFNLTPVSDATYTIDIAAGAAQDASDNDSLAATQMSMEYAEESSTCAEGGVLFAEYCWYQITSNQVSCNDLCADKGGYHLATRFFAGSDGSYANCVDVAQMINPSATAESGPSYTSSNDNYGCNIRSNGKVYRGGQTTSPYATSTRDIICACRGGSQSVPPTNVTGLAAENLGVDGIKLTWGGAAIGNYEYKISYAQGGVAPADCSSSQVTVTEEMAYITNLTAGTEYSFRVCSSSGDGEYSDSVGSTISQTTEAIDPVAVASRPVLENSFRQSFDDDETTISGNVTVSGTNTLLMVLIENPMDSEDPIPLDAGDVTANGQVLTKLSDVNTNYMWGGKFQVWYLVNPASGVNTVTVNFNEEVEGSYLHLTSFSGVNQASPFGTITTRNHNQNSNTEISVTSGQDRLIYGARTNTMMTMMTSYTIHYPTNFVLNHSRMFMGFFYHSQVFIYNSGSNYTFYGKYNDTSIVEEGLVLIPLMPVE